MENDNDKLNIEVSPNILNKSLNLLFPLRWICVMEKGKITPAPLDLCDGKKRC